MKTSIVIAATILTLFARGGGPAFANDPPAGDQTAELAKKLANPLAALISVPLQYNHDENIGAGDEGSMDKLILQPIIPFSLSKEWNLITRTIVPLIDQQDIPVPGQNASGLGDLTASQFFSPKAPTAGGWLWGAGPVELLPTASETLLGTGKWGLGPTAVALKQSGHWTAGALVNHIWSVAGDQDRTDVSATFVQPFLSYVTKTHTTLAVYTETTYDWEGEAWSMPVVLSVGQILKIGPQIFQVTLGARYWAESPDNGPEGWGARFVLTLLYPQ
jgi:hypothetical protein